MLKSLLQIRKYFVNGNFGEKQIRDNYLEHFQVLSKNHKYLKIFL